MADLAQLCVAYVNTIFSDSVFRVAFPVVEGAAQRECLVAKIYGLCAETLRLSQSEPEGQAPEKAGAEAAEDWRKWTGETAKVADAYKREKCHPDNDTLAVRRAYSAVHREWIRLHPGAVVPND